MALLATLKALPYTYNKDLQDDKRVLFAAIDDANDVVQLTDGIVSTLLVDGDATRADLSPEMLATDLADHLVRRGVPFREAHHIVGRVVKLADAERTTIDRLTLAQLRAVDARFGDDVARVFDFDASVESRDVDGGTSRRAVALQLEQLRQFVAGGSAPISASH